MTAYAKAGELLSRARKILENPPDVDAETLRFDIVMPLCAELIEVADSLQLRYYPIEREMIFNRIGKLQKLAGLQE